MTVLLWVGVALLGGAGAIARFALDDLVDDRVASELPWGTFAVNMTGAFTLGVLAGAGVTGDGLLLAGTGLLGSYTTFSTWLFESHRLAEEAQPTAAALNIVVSLAVGIGAAALGRLVGGAF